MMDVNQTYCCSHFIIHLNIKSLRCIPETNITLMSNIPQLKKPLCKVTKINGIELSE